MPHVHKVTTLWCSVLEFWASLVLSQNKIIYCAHQVLERPFHTSLCCFNIIFCNTPTISFWKWLVRGSPTGCTAPTHTQAHTHLIENKRWRKCLSLSVDKYGSSLSENVRPQLPSMTAYCRHAPGISFKMFLSFPSMVKCGASCQHKTHTIWVCRTHSAKDRLQVPVTWNFN